MPTPAGPNMTGPDWTDVSSLMMAMSALHKVDMAIHLTTSPLDTVGTLGVIVEASPKAGILSTTEARSLILARRYDSCYAGSLPKMLVGDLYALDSVLSKVVWEQLSLPEA